VSPAVIRGHVYAACVVIPLQLWNDVSICSNGEVIRTSGSAAMLPLTAENMSPIVTWSNVNFLVSSLFSDFV